RIKSNMGNKALSHDSIFMLEPETERSAIKMHPSLESQRGRPLQRSHVSRTLPRIGTSNVHGALSGAMFGVVPRYVPRSGVWVAGSKITEIPPLRPRQPSISPPLIRSGTISKDMEEISGDDELPPNPHMKASSRKILAAKKNFSEPSTGMGFSQSSIACTSPNITQQPVGFSIPATTQGCLDSSAARHKMALNPRKQKKKKSLQASVKPKQEETKFPLISEGERNTNNSKEIDQKKLNKDGAGPFNQEQSHKTGIYDHKISEKAPNTDAARNMNYPMLAAYGRRRRRKVSNVSGTNEYGSRGRCLLQSCQMHGLVDRYDYSSMDKTAGDCPFRHLALEKQAMEQLTTPQAETTISQELLSDKGDMGKKNFGLEVRAKKAPAPQPIPKDMVESMVSGPPLYNENGACGAKKPEGRASLLPIVGRISKTQEEDILSVAAETQVLRDPSYIQSGEEEASSHGLQNAQSKMELAQVVPTICKEKSPGSVLHSFTVIIPGMAGTVAEGSLSTERLSPRSLSQSLEKPEDEEVSSNSNSASEEGSDAEKQLAPEHSFQSSQGPEGEQEVFPQSKSFIVEMSGLEQQRAPEYSHQFLGRPKAKEVSSDSESSTEEGRGAEELAAIRFSRSLRKLERVFSESKRFAATSMSEERLTLQESEDIEASTESNSYAEKCNSADDWSSLEEDVSLRHSDQALGKPKDQREVRSVSRNTPKDWRVSVKQKAPRHPSQTTTVQQQVFPSSVSISAGYSGSVEPLLPSCPFQPWLSPKFRRQGSIGPEKTAIEWGIFREPLPPRMTSKRLKRSIVEQKLSPYSEITTREEVVSMELLPPRCPSQPSVRPKEKQVPLGAESATVVGEVSMEPLPLKLHSQPLRRPLVQPQVSAGPRSIAVEGSISVDLRPPINPFQPWLNPPMGQQTSSFPESKAIEGPPKLLSKPLINPKVQQNMFSGSEGVTSMEPLYPKYSPQSITNPHIQQIFSEGTAVEQGIFMDLPPGKPLVRSHFQPQMTLDSMNISSQWNNPEDPVPARPSFQPWMNPKFKENISADPESTEAEGSISAESVPPRHPLQSWLFSAFKPASAGPESSAIQWGIPTVPPVPRMPPLPTMRPVMKQPISTGLASASAQWSDSVEPMPPRNPFPPWVSSKFEQQVSADPENSEAEGNISVELRPPGYHLQTQKRPAVKQEISSGSVSTSTERICPMPPRYTYQPWGNPQIEQQDSTDPENIAIEGGSSRDVPFPKPHSRSVMKHVVQKGSSSFESAVVEEGIPGRALPPEYPTQFSVRSKVQEMSSRLENPSAEEYFSKKSLLPSPSQSFVKFMAQQIFSESAIYADPVSLHHSSRSLLRPKVERQVSSDWENADPEGGIPLKKLPMKHTLQSVGRPEGPQEGLSYSENAPGKWSSSKGQVPTRQFSQVLGKFEYHQEVSSVSDDSPEEWRSSEEQMPPRHPSQTLDGSEQPPTLPAGSGNVPVEWNSPAEPLPPCNPFQAFGNPGYQQQAHSSSASAGAEATNFENNPGSWSLPKCPASPKKTKKHSPVSEDFVKSIPVSANKPGKLTVTPAGKTPISGATYTKEEVLKSATGNNNGHSVMPTNEAEVESLFGVRLRRIPSPQKLKNEKRDNLTQLSSPPLGQVVLSVGKEQRMRRSNPQVFLSTTENLSDISNFAEKQQSRHKSEGMVKWQSAYKPPGKPQQSDCAITESVWISMTKQRQRGSQVYVPVKESKSTSRTGAKDETKDPRYGGVGPTNESQLRKILTSTLHIQEKMPLVKPPKPAKSVAFEDQKMLRMPATDKETKRSSSLPAGLEQSFEPVNPVEPVEPVWFSMAKKKAKAWSQIAEIMQ
ncbi:hypothetical protein SUZIE_133645, partial [Sciurus carolinensis]|nr:hypothetical protein [Sciurus carolinensis]